MEKDVEYSIQLFNPLEVRAVVGIFHVRRKEGPSLHKKFHPQLVLALVTTCNVDPILKKKMQTSW